MQDNVCPMNRNCLALSLVYEATISSTLPNYTPMKYIGLCESTFKKLYLSHVSSFCLIPYRNVSTLSSKYWRLKELNGNPSVTWRIIRHAKAYRPESKACRLYLCEKFEIANYPEKNLLNKRTEVEAKCRHRNTYSTNQPCRTGLENVTWTFL